MDNINIKAAYETIKNYIHHTPVLTCSTLNSITKSELFFKCENLQKIGAFKIRGALNAVLSIPDDEVKYGVATHSSGNHAQALALAAKWRGVKSYVVMPSNSSPVKIAAVKGYGATVIFCEPTLEARESTLEEIIKNTKAYFIHPYNNERVIEGQGTAALELINDIPDLDYILAPVGGGGLLSGTAIAARTFSRQTKVIGTEPEQADDAYQSFVAGRIIPVNHPDTIADGLRTSLGTLTFPIIKQHVHQIVTVSEKSIIEAMFWIWERMKVIIEPSSAVPVAAILEKKLDITGKRVGVILSGGNVDLKRLSFGAYTESFPPGC